MSRQIPVSSGGGISSSNDFQISGDLENGQVLVWDSQLQKWTNSSGSESESHYHEYFELTITYDGQTVFTMPYTPKSTQSVILQVNGIGYSLTNDYTISGTTLTWLNSEFVLQTTDSLEVYMSV